MKVLVLGGAGYIGSHMVRMLEQAGREVAVFDNFSTGHRGAVVGRRVFHGDLLVSADIDQALRSFRPQLVMHFAARSLVGESMVEPGFYYRSNVAGSLNLLDALRNHGIERLVFSSTAATYGDPQYSPIDELHPLLPINTYGWSKLFVERMIADYSRAYGLRAVALRYFNAAGADFAGGIGEAHEPETHLIPNVLRACVGSIAQLTLHGDDFDTRDGFCIRDFIHVNDLCDAHIRAAAALDDASRPAFQIYNLGTGNGYSVMDVLRAAETVVGRPIPHTVGPRRAGDPATLVASAARAQAELGWQAQHTSMETIIESAWRWHQQPHY